MSVRIRLRRVGKGAKKRHYFRITVCDKKVSRDSRIIEDLGYYDPSKKPMVLVIKEERLNFWQKRGAQPSETIRRLLKKKKTTQTKPVESEPKEK